MIVLISVWCPLFERVQASTKNAVLSFKLEYNRYMKIKSIAMVMGTASTMAVMAETLGFMLPGSATAPAVSSDRWRFAEATGKRAAEMAKTGSPRPSELLTKSTLKNASVVLQATSGSTNAIVHLAAIAGRAGITYDLQELDRVGRDVPVLLDLKPAGNNFMEMMVLCLSSRPRPTNEQKVSR